MIDATADLDAALDDCGGSAETVNGPLVGRLVTESLEIEIGDRIVLSSETVYYASRLAIDKVRLVKDAWIDIGTERYFVKEIPKPDSSGLVRIGLKQ